MDYPLLLYTLLVFAAASWGGGCEYRRMVQRRPEASLAQFHRQPGWVRFLLLFLALLLAPEMYGVTHPAALWKLPDWLDLSMLWWANGLSAVLFGLLLGLAWSASRRESLPNLRALLLATSLGQAGLLGMTAWMQRLVASELNAQKWSGQMLRQTSGYSCAAASGANVAGFLGLSYSEQEMARFMGTRATGTSPAAIIRGLRRAGIAGRKFEDATVNLEAMPLPAILIVDHPAAGPESHAVAALIYHADVKTVEIWDPISGRETLTQTELKRIWPGRGIACQRLLKPRALRAPPRQAAAEHGALADLPALARKMIL